MIEGVTLTLSRYAYSLPLTRLRLLANPYSLPLTRLRLLVYTYSLPRTRLRLLFTLIRLRPVEQNTATKQVGEG